MVVSSIHARLTLCRHGESETNAANVFTGWFDPPLTGRGRQEGLAVAQRLAKDGLLPDRVFTSELQRCHQTVAIILAALDREHVPVTRSPALNERDYGELTGLNKAAAAERWGAEQVRRWRRSYADAPPGGESLRDTAARVLGYYVRAVLPAVLGGGTTLVVAHGNSLRALVMALDGMDASTIERFDLSTGATLLYDLAADSSIIGRHILG